MSVQDFITRVVPAAILSKTYFAEDVYYYPGGDAGQKVKITAVVDEAGLEGSNEVSGDGKNVEKQEGRILRYSMNIEVLRSDNIILGDSPENRRHRSVFRIFESAAELALFEAGDECEGTLYRIKRLVGQDRDTQTFLCVRVDRRTIMRESKRG